MYCHTNRPCKFLLQYISKTIAEADASNCLENGFAPNLMCSSCDQLGQFKLERLADQCMQCCQEDTDSGKQVCYCIEHIYQPGSFTELLVMQGISHLSHSWYSMNMLQPVLSAQSM